METIRVIHCKRHNFDIYIGRKFGGFPQSKWANPFHIGKDGDRESVLMKYEKWILTQESLVSYPRINS